MCLPLPALLCRSPHLRRARVGRMCLSLPNRQVSAELLQPLYTVCPSACNCFQRVDPAYEWLQPCLFLPCTPKHWLLCTCAQCIFARKEHMLVCRTSCMCMIVWNLCMFAWKLSERAECILAWKECMLSARGAWLHAQCHLFCAACLVFPCASSC